MKYILIAAILLLGASVSVGQSAAQATDTSSKPAAATAHPDVPTPAPLEPVATGEPHTEMLDTANSAADYDPLLEPKPLPKAGLSLVGGIARKVDMVHNRVTVQPFGGGQRYVIYFDERTRILSGGRETTVLAIHPGDRVYADTQALGAQVFARTIQVRSVGGEARASGQVIEVLGGQVRLQDRLSGQMIRFVISDRTKVEARGGKPSSADELHSGSLIDVTFIPGRRSSEAQKITICASPGQAYVFAGVLTHVDIRDGVLALDNDVDGNNYELFFDPLSEKNVGRLVVGAPVSVTASFDGKRYRATSITLTEAATTSNQ
jgi:hypothetical protein